MIIRFRELCCKEVINICDGRRLGYVSDLELEAESGRIISLSVPCPGRFFGLFGARGIYVLPWQCIRRIGDDLILVDVCLEDVRHPKEKRGIFS
ncbi:MAG: YlmC/YmxH family sporulation protein [Oscillospiraceae bacterium]|nr:YlmC/YmxH family sporulation protein [Oscillospiraceae bacterium]